MAANALQFLDLNWNHGVDGCIDSVMAMPRTIYGTLAADIRAGAHYDLLMFGMTYLLAYCIVMGAMDL